MKQEFDEQLCAKYPLIFRDRTAPMTHTAMCWGFDHGNGWYNIINQLCANIQHHIDWKQKQHDHAVKYNEMVQAGLAGDLTLLDDYHKGWLNADKFIAEALKKGPRDVPPTVPQVVADQIKEKFGTLRFYYHGGDDIIDGMVRMAEAMSAVTCEDCGVPGKIRRGAWIRTLCDVHAEEHGYHSDDGNDENDEQD